MYLRTLFINSSQAPVTRLIYQIFQPYRFFGVSKVYEIKRTLKVKDKIICTLFSILPLVLSSYSLSFFLVLSLFLYLFLSLIFFLSLSLFKLGKMIWNTLNSMHSFISETIEHSLLTLFQFPTWKELKNIYTCKLW